MAQLMTSFCMVNLHVHSAGINVHRNYNDVQGQNILRNLKLLFISKYLC